MQRRQGSEATDLRSLPLIPSSNQIVCLFSLREKNKSTRSVDSTASVTRRLTDLLFEPGQGLLETMP